MSNYSSSNYQPENPNSSWYKVYNIIHPNSSVLDVGCSSGNFGEVIIKNKNCVVDGVELDQKDATSAQKKLRKVYNINIETDSIDAIKDKYDYIYFGDVIEHLVNPSQTLKRIKPLLKKDGKILFSIPNMSHVSVRLLLLSGGFNYGETGLLDKTHLHFYTLDELNRILNEAGIGIDMFDPVIKDYPSVLIDKELSKIGLKNTKSFTNFINSTDASIYQLVGSASYKIQPKKIKLDPVSPRDTFSQLLDQTVNHYKTIQKNTEEYAKQLEGQLKQLESHIKQLESQLKDIKNSRSYKLSKRVSSFKSKFIKH